jgi:hypothetical protein
MMLDELQGRKITALVLGLIEFSTTPLRAAEIL